MPIALEQMRHPNKPDIIIPHYPPRLLALSLTRQLELVIEHYHHQHTHTIANKSQKTNSPSSESLPVKP